MTATVAALYVSRTGPYWGRPDVDAWDEERDARTYAGPLPVVAHPPCAAWCMLAGLREHVYGLPRGADGGCFAAALEAVRRWGGVLEHPAWSRAWPAFGLPEPPATGWQQALDGSWSCEVSQAAYGHRARKLTWLLYVGATPPPALDWSRPETEAVMAGGRPAAKPNVWHREANRTPPAFAELLLSLARRAGQEESNAKP